MEQIQLSIINPNSNLIINQPETEEHSTNLIDENNSPSLNTFPERIIGNVEKQGKLLGLYHYRYLELDSRQGEIRRYLKPTDFPSKPKEIIKIKQIKSLIKDKKEPESDYYTFQMKINKDNNTVEVHIYRIRYLHSLIQWFKAFKILHNHFKKEMPLPTILHETLFIDDCMGITQNFTKQPQYPLKLIEMNIQDYCILNIIGCGTFSTVYQVRHKHSNKIYAMKVMDKNILIQNKHLHYIITEFNILKQLVQCPFTLKLHCAFQSANYLYMVLDYCSCGDITSISTINNKKLLYAEIILAFEYLHNKGIIYRDLKPENILLSNEGHIKLCDFNLSKEGIINNSRAFSFCGSPLYLSPEMLGSFGVGLASDIFGIGLIMYEIETGVPAFYSKTSQELCEKIVNVLVDYNVKQIDPVIKDLIENILIKNERSRFTIKNIKEHKYFEGFDWGKAWRKKYGEIKIEKRMDCKRNENYHYDTGNKKISINEINKDFYRTMHYKISNFFFISDEMFQNINNPESIPISEHSNPEDKM